LHAFLFSIYKGRQLIVDEAHVSEDYNFTQYNDKQRQIISVTGTPKEAVILGRAKEITATLGSNTPYSIENFYFEHTDGYGTKVELQIKQVLKEGKKVLIFHDSVKACKTLAEEYCTKRIKAEALYSGHTEMDPSTQVFVATSCAEDGLTIPNVGLVVNHAYCYKGLYGNDFKDMQLTKFQTNDSQNTQRRGRTGRTCQGIYYEIRHSELEKCKPSSSVRENFLKFLAENSSIPNSSRLLFNTYNVPPDLCLAHGTNAGISMVMKKTLLSLNVATNDVLVDTRFEGEKSTHLAKWFQKNYSDGQLNDVTSALLKGESCSNEAMPRSVISYLLSQQLTCNGVKVRNIEVDKDGVRANLSLPEIPGSWPYLIKVKEIGFFPMKVSLEAVLDVALLRNISVVHASLGSKGFKFKTFKDSKFYKHATAFFSQVHSNMTDLKDSFPTVFDETLLKFKERTHEVSSAIVESEHWPVVAACAAWGAAIWGIGKVASYVYRKVKNWFSEEPKIVIKNMPDDSRWYHNVPYKTLAFGVACLATIYYYWQADPQLQPAPWIPVLSLMPVKCSLPIIPALNAIPFISAVWIISKNKVEADSVVKPDAIEKWGSAVAFKIMLTSVTLMAFWFCCLLGVVDSFVFATSYAIGSAVAIMLSRSQTFREAKKTKYSLLGIILSLISCVYNVYWYSLPGLLTSFATLYFSQDGDMTPAIGASLYSFLPPYLSLTISVLIFCFEEKGEYWKTL